MPLTVPLLEMNSVRTSAAFLMVLKPLVSGGKLLWKRFITAKSHDTLTTTNNTANNRYVLIFVFLVRVRVILWLLLLLLLVVVVVVVV
jgi:hypothetical protein